MALKRTAALLLFLFGTFPVRAQQSVLSVLLRTTDASADAGAPMGRWSPGEGHDRPGSRRRVRLSRVPRLVPSKVDVAASAGLTAVAHAVPCSPLPAGAFARAAAPACASPSLARAWRSLPARAPPTAALA